MDQQQREETSIQIFTALVLLVAVGAAGLGLIWVVDELVGLGGELGGTLTKAVEAGAVVVAIGYLVRRRKPVR